MINFTQEGLLDHLKEKGLKPELQKETGQIYVVNKTKAGEFPIFLRIYENQTQLQIIVFFPTQIPDNRLDSVSRLLHHLNKEVDMPGFGLDEDLRLVFHRTMIPVYGPYLGSTILDLYIGAIPGLCENIYPLIQQAISSKLSFDEIKQKIKEHTPKK